MKRWIVTLLLFLLLGAIVHVLPTVAEVSQVQRYERWWTDDYFTMDYVGLLDGEYAVCGWNWWAGIPLTWIEGQMPGSWHIRWFALFVNSAMWGLALWAIWACIRLVHRLRKAARMSRGLCPTCTYPVGASDLCTECGKPVTRP